MSTIQADILQLSRLVDGMLLKWCLQSGSFLLGEVEEGRNGWELCQGAALSFWCVGALPNGWLPLWPLPTQLSTRQLGKFREGWWQAYAKSLEQGYALASYEGWRLHGGLSGMSVSTAQVTDGVSQVTKINILLPMQCPSLGWSLLLLSEFLIIHPRMCFALVCWCVYIYTKEFH